MSVLATRCRAATFAIAATLLCGLALGQVPGMSKLGTATSKNDASKPASKPTSASQTTGNTDPVAELRSRLATETRLLEILDAPNGLSTGAPPGTDERALRGRQIRVAVLVRTLAQHLSELEKLDKVRERRAAVEKEMNAWAGPADKPPYSILLADQLRAAHQAARVNLEGLQARQELLRQTTAEMRERVKSAQQELRQITEKAEQARSEADQAKNSWERDLASLQIRVTEALLGYQDATRQLLDEQIATAQLEIEFARRKLEPVAAAIRFSAEDLAQARAALTTERDTLTAELDRLTREQARLQAATEAASKASAALRTTGGRAGETEAQYLARLYRLEQDFELKRAYLEASSTHMDYLRQVLDFNRTSGLLWNARYEGHHKQDADSRMVARNTAEKMLGYLNAQKKQLEYLHKNANNRVMDVEKRMENANLPAQNSYLRELQKVYGENAISLQRTLAALDSNVTLAEQMLTEFGGASSQRSLTDRGEDWQLTLKRYATAFWNLELLAVEDTIEVDGKQIAGKRSVTIGKTLSALLLIIAGYALAVVIARLGERMLIRHFGWQPTHAAILRRWLLAAEMVVLIIIALVWVKIPLTVFAFLGGAVAIGLGFGMQTLLKNLISGLMVLGEQPFRIGDLVEVGGIRGNVTNIGLRASTITDVNGIETIIPNSTFIEQNLTNWTHTSGRVRFNVKVGVAYGSPVRTVTQLLEEIAGRHGQILKSPAPEVLFEDFASDALNFSLYYWLDVGAGTIARRVASELRAMIESGFSAKGIAIPYAQRDVHLDVAAPVPVRIVS